MRLKLIRVGLLVEFSNHYTIRGALVIIAVHSRREVTSKGKLKIKTHPKIKHKMEKLCITGGGVIKRALHM